MNNPDLFATLFKLLVFAFWFSTGAMIAHAILLHFKTRKLKRRHAELLAKAKWN